MSLLPNYATESNSEHSCDEEELKFQSSAIPIKESADGPPSCTTTMASTTSPSTKYDASSLLPNIELRSSLTTVTPIESLASRRSRILPKSPQVLAMLQKYEERQLVDTHTETKPTTNAPHDLTSDVSSLISNSTYSISLDDNDLVLPPPKTTQHKLPEDLELDDNDAENMQSGANLSIITSIRGDESVSKPKTQHSDVKDKEFKNQHTKIDHLRQRRQLNKRNRQHEQRNNNDTMSNISALTFDCNMSFKPMPRRTTPLEVRNASILTTNSYLQRLNNHQENICATTDYHPSINANKLERFEFIKERIMQLQTENHKMKAGNMHFSQQFESSQDPTTVKLNDQVKRVELENHDLRAQNQNLKIQLKKQGQMLVEMDALYRKHQQQNSIVLPSPQENKHTSAATLTAQCKEIESQRDAYMATKKKLDDKRDQCRDILTGGSISPVPNEALNCTSSGRNRSVEDESGDKEHNAADMIYDEDDESFLSSSISLSDYEHKKDVNEATGDKVKAAQAMVVAKKLSQAEQEVVILTTKVKRLETLNGNLLRKFQDDDDDFCSFTKMETPSLKVQEEIFTLRGQLKQKNNAFMSMEQELVGARAEILDLKEMHEFEMRQIRTEYDNMRGETARLVGWLKNQLTVYQRKLGVEGDQDAEERCEDDDYNYNSYESNMRANAINNYGSASSENKSTIEENKKILAEFYRAQQYLQDAHNQAVDEDTGVVSTTGMEGLSKKEQQDLVREIAEERVRWQATTSPPVTPNRGGCNIPLVVDLNQ